MTIDKFGRYLQLDTQKRKPQNQLKVFKHQVNFENRLLRNISKGILKYDAVNKEQLDGVLSMCAARIDKVSANLEKLISRKFTLIKPTTTAPNTTSVTIDKAPELMGGKKKKLKSLKENKEPVTT